MIIVIAEMMEDEVVNGIKAIGTVVYKPNDLKGALKDADVLIVRSATKVTAELIEDASKLKVVARAGVGLDNVDQMACAKKRITVLNTPGASTNAVAELVIGLMIATLRNVQKSHCQMKSGRWEKKNLTGSEISGKTLGILGYGRIGSSVAKKAQALGMKVIAYNPPPRHEDSIAEFVDSLDAFLGNSDIITLHAALTEGTKSIINRENIAKMKNGVYLINTARGEMIDDDALYEACKSGKISGASIDVYREEPYKGRLLELENVYFTPHLGASTKEAQMRIGQELIKALEDELGV